LAEAESHALQGCSAIFGNSFGPPAAQIARTQNESGRLTQNDHARRMD
jgi:hypothetical protein